MGYVVKLLVPAGLTALVGCSDATGAIHGGDALFSVPVVDAGSSEGGGQTTNLTSADCMGDGGHAGTTWTDLYTCYFGMSGPDSCAGTGASCHATSASAGGGSWVCGTTQASCYQGMTAYAPLDPRSGASNPTMNHLYGVLCGSPAGSGGTCQAAGGTCGVMPFGCPPGTTLFSDDFKRIEAWIAAGAPNN
jgi:hypothetical protein